MPITLDGTLGITTPSYGGADAAEYLVPVTAFKNRIINGNMAIDQRNAGASVALTDGNTQYVFPTDRWACSRAAGATATGQQSSNAPVGFTNSLLITNGTGISVASGGQGYIIQFIEGFNIADLGWGTASAQTVTVSFWVRSSLTGTHSGSLFNNAGNRCYPFTYTISSANTWEQKSVTIPGDTSGTWLTNNGRGISVCFNNGSGSSYLGAAGTWINSFVYGVTGSVALNSVTGSTWSVTGVQFEVGTNATYWDARSYGTELNLCLRYYTNNFYGTLINFWQSSLVGTWPRFPVPMRANPTISLSSGSNISIDIFGVGGSTFTITSADTLSQYGCRIFGTPAAPQPSGYIGHISSFNIQASAEL